ncbi:DUF1223 domain-containing protein [Jannaschia marina]|uniref:DUF1223 domain-containing protein n=1 Tax=Jannaschia marina TaxID=2741674 RepID=UPI0015C82A52|nr:DUF1223 domain-containing protein [Jannaschia marina]
MPKTPVKIPCLALCALAVAGPAAADPVVVELYTSQGCSSCPPADAMLGELAARDDVIALSLHVDYWDWIGWKDTFADPAHSERQLRYAEAAGSNVRYTPQFVIGGTDRVAGPSAMDLLEMIQAHEGATGDVLSVSGEVVTVGETRTEGQLIVVDYMPEATVTVLHGENAGRSITYHNVVQGWTMLQTLDGAATEVTVAGPEEGYRRVVLAQSVVGGKPGPMLGAVRLD